MFYEIFSLFTIILSTRLSVKILCACLGRRSHTYLLLLLFVFSEQNHSEEEEQALDNVVGGDPGLGLSQDGKFIKSVYPREIFLGTWSLDFTCAEDTNA